MIGLDTNIILRMLLDDDLAQKRRIVAMVAEHGTASNSLLVDNVVLAEVVWNLNTAYSHGKVAQIKALQSLLAESAYAFENRETLVKAVALFEHASCGFSDCLIAANNAELGCEFTATFDRKMRGIPAVKVI